ncbi:hypothetical protein IB274_15290 [Pseudomonas sp. PDM18]|uniref:hypothetical protein n=1 Tax=unclassified Pseudomonas TaxID=196821 RepID=UPI0017839732|nr:hypothetical protein [Pseudomonas sp. PDM18]MBD9678077.1 hypothetical protein [Pseudomonas sp. PDM18]
MGKDENTTSAHRASLYLRAERIQWFGLVLLFLAVGLAALTDFLQRDGGVATIVAFAVVGALALVVARLILLRPKPV